MTSTGTETEMRHPDHSGGIITHAPTREPAPPAISV